MSTHDVADRAFSQQSSRATKIEMAEKKNTRGKRLHNDKARSKTHVNIGSAFQRWRELKEWKACDRTQVALVLLDRLVTPCLHRTWRTATPNVCLQWTR